METHRVFDDAAHFLMLDFEVFIRCEMLINKIKKDLEGACSKKLSFKFKVAGNCHLISTVNLKISVFIWSLYLLCILPAYMLMSTVYWLLQVTWMFTKW